MSTRTTARNPSSAIEAKKANITAGSTAPLEYPLSGKPDYFMVLSPIKYVQTVAGLEPDKIDITISSGSKSIPVVKAGSTSGKTIMLPLPEQIQDQLNLNYNSIDLGMVAAGFRAGAAIGDAFSSGGFGAGISSMKTELMAGGNYALRSAIGGISDEVGALVNSGMGDVPNPYSTLLFKNVDQRQFQFSFNFAPASKQESDVLKEIINQIRYLSLPREDKNFLDFPYEWEISFGGTDYLFSMSRGVITDFQVSYGASGGMAFFKDTGAPQFVKMSFTFKEIFPMNKTLIDISGSSMTPITNQRGANDAVQSLDSASRDRGTVLTIPPAANTSA